MKMQENGWESLRSGITLDQIQKAAKMSGYPLQTEVATLLNSMGFDVQDEWSYLDQNSAQPRTIDIRANIQLRNLPSEESRIRPHLTLIIECKKSDMPYVFFRNNPRIALEFPFIFGLSNKWVQVETDDDRSTWKFSVSEVLGMDDHSFVTNALCSSIFSKCVRRGKEVELSGSEAYSSTVFPLVSAVQHFERMCTPPKTAFWFDARLTICLAVLDAPMISIDPTAGEGEASPVPWVRVLRNEPSDKPRILAEQGKVWAIDFVHKDYLGDYLKNHAIPYAEMFAEKACYHDQVLGSMQGFVKGLGAGRWDVIKNEVEPLSILIGPSSRIPVGSLANLNLRAKMMIKEMNLNSSRRKRSR
ncbi:hypothetical protein [Streptosporangium minutum]|uniref:hypothetical protein n=1 Tax=Streptosporangium minutum TaxID=569862 RepID=UPI0010568449|nr:hypothetical protein [Streptosporangium minutum]